MKNNKRGFTLLEVLVVVLIIGILAAVAVPQYRLAVDKSRFSTMMAYVNAIVEAQNMYYLANNEYAVDYDKLDVDWLVSTDDGENYYLGQFQVNYGSSYSALYLLDDDKKRIAGYVVYYPNDRRCFAYEVGGGIKRGQKICESMGGEKLWGPSNACGEVCISYQL